MPYENTSLCEQQFPLARRCTRAEVLHELVAVIVLDRRVEELSNASELDDAFEFLGDLSAAHAENRPAQENILATGELSVKSRADFDQRRQPAADGDLTPGRRGDFRQQLKNGAFAGAVGSDDAQGLSATNREAYVLQGLEIASGSLQASSQQREPVGAAAGGGRDSIFF